MENNVKKEYLLRVEFRYHKMPISDIASDSVFKKMTIGVYDNVEDAVNNGNLTLNKIKAKGLTVRENFKVKGFMGRHTDLVTNCCGNDKIKYFVTITTLTYDDIDEVIATAKKDDAKYRKWRE